MMIYTFSLFQDVPLKTWIKFRDEILDESMVLDGRGPFHELCAGCRAPNPLYRCQECALGRPLWCQLCMLKRHSQSPLHIVEVRRTLPFPVVFSDNDGYRDASRCGTESFSSGRHYVILAYVYS